MKAVKIIVKILVALAAIAGVVYVIATYGNQIVAWCKKVLASLPCCKDKETCNAEVVEVEAEAVAEEAAEEEAPVEVVEAVEEAPADAAEEADFES